MDHVARVTEKTFVMDDGQAVPMRSHEQTVLLHTYRAYCLSRGPSLTDTLDDLRKYREHYSNRKPLLVFIGLLGAVSAALVAHFISRIQLYFAAKQYLLDSLTKLYHNEGYQLYYAAFEKRKIFTF